MKLRGRLGPPRRDDELAWQSAHIAGLWAENVSVNDYRPQRGIDTPYIEPDRTGVRRG